MFRLVQRIKPAKVNQVHSITFRVSKNGIELFIDYQPITSDNIADFMLTVFRIVFTAIFRVLVFIDQNTEEIYNIITTVLKIVSRIFKH